MRVIKLLTYITHCANMVLTEANMKYALLLIAFTLPLVIAMVSVRDTEMRYKRITDKIGSQR